MHCWTSQQWHTAAMCYNMCSLPANRLITIFSKRHKMSDFMVSVGLFVAGGIFGIVCDRLWQKVEKRIRLRIQGGFRDGIDGEGILFKVKNEGKERLPPIRLCLFGRELGSYFIFPADCSESERNELWPGQEREFFCRISPSQAPGLDTNPMLKNVANAANDPRIVFRVQPVDGDTVIFRNHRIGKAVACILAAWIAGIQEPSDVWGKLHYERRGPIAWIRHKLYIRSLLREAARIPQHNQPDV